ncbi:MAG: SRPBCC family protein [Elusimicrobia bacterium]|nr:SRPBCC family protein [Elusimicrobiota bacterium]
MLNALALSLALAQARAADVTVAPERGPDGASRVEAEFSVAVPPAVAWEVLTDYNELPRFITSLRESRVVRRWAGGCLVRQAARLEWWMLRRTVSVTLRVSERPKEELSFEDAAKGDVARYAGSWRLFAGQESVRVRYRLEVRPKDWVPGFVARQAVAAQARQALEEVRREMIRRAAAKREMAERFQRRRGRSGR